MDDDADSATAEPVDPPEPDPPLGTVLKDRFELDCVLGTGGMGVIYRAIDWRRAEAGDPAPYVAIKVLAPNLRGEEEPALALMREALKAQALRHPNILRVLDQDRDAELTFVLMEYVEGESLDGIIARNREQGLPTAVALRILRDLARALHFLHEHGVVHADLKPANALLSRAGTLKLLDFGLSGSFIAPLAEELDYAFTVAEAFGGATPAYAGAERLDDADLDPSDDLYALALIGYELLTGQHPYERKSGAVIRDEGAMPAAPAGLRRRQWRALCHAMVPVRSGRTATVARFLREFDGRPAWLWRGWDAIGDGFRSVPLAFRPVLRQRRKKARR